MFKASEGKEKILHRIRGSRVVIPDLFALFPGWKFNVNRHYDSVKIKTDKWLESWVESDSLRRQMKSADLAKLAACFYPDAHEDECLTTAYYHLWVFVWDDELDCGPLTDDPKRALLYKHETDLALDYMLGDQIFNGDPPQLGSIMSAFSCIATRVAAGMTVDARQRLLSELKRYMDVACTLPSHRQNGYSDILTVEGFLEHRRESGGCGASVMFALYAYHLDLPASIMNHEAITTITDQVCQLVNLLNDIFSFHKELNVGQIDNIIPILVVKHEYSLQEAIHDACGLVCEARKILESAEGRVPVPTGDHGLDEGIKRYIQACKDIVAGLVTWSFGNERYFGPNFEQEGNKISFNIL